MMKTNLGINNSKHCAVKNIDIFNKFSLKPTIKKWCSASLNAFNRIISLIRQTKYCRQWE